MNDEQTQTTSSLSSSSERIELIIEAAERAAAGIIEDAESQARRDPKTHDGAPMRSPTSAAPHSPTWPTR